MVSSLVTGHTSGVSYRSRYWGLTYTVTAVHADGAVTVAWPDGRTTTHCTSRRPGGPAEGDEAISLMVGCDGQAAQA